MALDPVRTLPRQPSSGPLRVAFFGSPALALPTLEALLAAPELAAVVLVVSQPDRPAGRGQRLTPPPVAARAKELQLPLLQPEKIRTGPFGEALRAARPDVAVVIAYGRILPTEILETPRLGCINVHASLLPRWRGAGPIQWAILAGDEATGVSTMWMEEGLDTGPVLLSKRIPIDARENAVTLGEKVAHEGAALLVETLRELLAGRLRAHPQPEGGVTIARLLVRDDGRIRWEAGAKDAERMVRALGPSPGAFCSYRGEDLKILDAEAVPRAAEDGCAPGTILQTTPSLTVRCGDGALWIHRLQAAGRKPLPADEFLRGHALTPGERLEA